MKQRKRYQKIFSIFLICFLLNLLVLVFFVPRVLAENIVKFADSELKKSVRETLGISKEQGNYSKKYKKTEKIVR